MIKDMFQIIRRTVSGQAAKNDVAEIIRHHRIQASPGYRSAANYVLTELQNAGLEAQIERFPANDQATFWTLSSFQEWEARGATLHLTGPDGQTENLADYRDAKLSLIQRSAPFEGEAEVVLLENGLTDREYSQIDVAGKIVLTHGAVERVRQLAVEKYGAIGILFYGMASAPPVREAMDLPDALQYTSFWWSGGDTKCFGFVLSPRQGEKLANIARQRAAANQPPLKVRAEVDTRFYDGDFEVVTALIPGQTPETALVVSHLCHPQPSANDNASGAAATLEAARCLSRLIEQGHLPQPKRSIRFLWMPEMTGSFAWLANHEAEIANLVAGVNLDMVGEDQSQTGSIFQIERPPDASSSFAPDLLERLREELFDDAGTLTGLGSFPLFRYGTANFSGGSDHYIFSDPTVGVPMPMLIQWPDKFYHTSADTLDKVDPAMLNRAATLAAAYAYFVASAGSHEAAWLAHEMLARFQVRLAQITQAQITQMHESDNHSEVRLAHTFLNRQHAYRLTCLQDGLRSLLRLSKKVALLNDQLQSDAEQFAENQLIRAQDIMDSRLETLGEESLRKNTVQLDRWERKAATLKPLRHYRGPENPIKGMAGLSEEDRNLWYKLVSSRGGGSRTLPTLAEYWVNGERTVLEIVDLVEMETGLRDAELIVSRFELLNKVGLVSFS